MLQHASIGTFVRHYSVAIHVDAQAIVRGMPAQKQLMPFSCSMSRSIDPCRPYRLNDSSYINDVPSDALEEEFGDGPPQSGSRFRVNSKRWKAQEKSVKKFQQKYDRAEEQYDHSVKQLRNEKGRQRHRLVRENLERYKNEQLVIDSERQLSRKMVDEEVKVALERTGYMTPQHMTLIDTVLTIPRTTVDKEYERRIASISAVVAVCDAFDILSTAPMPKGRSPQLQMQVMLFLEPSLRFASSLPKRHQRFASFPLETL
ncbi:hypothetical protein BDV12DRAFT_200775 [Aspergillus spectabilis]